MLIARMGTAPELELLASARHPSSYGRCRFRLSCQRPQSRPASREKPVLPGQSNRRLGVQNLARVSTGLAPEDRT